MEREAWSGTDIGKPCKRETGWELAKKSDMEMEAWTGRDRGKTWKLEAGGEQTEN